MLLHTRSLRVRRDLYEAANTRLEQPRPAGSQQSSHPDDTRGMHDERNV